MLIESGALGSNIFSRRMRTKSVLNTPELYGYSKEIESPDPGEGQL